MNERAVSTEQVPRVREVRNWKNTEYERDIEIGRPKRIFVEHQSSLC